MKWSSEKPQVPGWYWFKTKTDDGYGTPNPRVVYIVAIKDGLLTERQTDGYEPYFDDEGQWAGPLVPPEE